MTETIKNILFVISLGVLFSVFVALIKEAGGPNQNTPINQLNPTILFYSGEEYSVPKNIRYKSMNEYYEKTSYDWTPFVQGIRLYESTIYVFCMDDEEGNTYTSEIYTAAKDVFIVPKSCPTDGTCTLDKDCRGSR